MYIYIHKYIHIYIYIYIFMWSLIADVTSFCPPCQSLERLGIRQPSKQNLHTIAAAFQAYHGTKKWLKDSTTDLHIFLSTETNFVPVRRHSSKIFRTSLRSMPGEENAVGRNLAELFLADGESLIGDSIMLDFTSPEFCDDRVQDVESVSLSERDVRSPAFDFHCGSTSSQYVHARERYYVIELDVFRTISIDM